MALTTFIMDKYYDSFIYSNHFNEIVDCLGSHSAESDINLVVNLTILDSSLPKPRVNTNSIHLHQLCENCLSSETTLA